VLSSESLKNPKTMFPFEETDTYIPIIEK